MNSVVTLEKNISHLLDRAEQLIKIQSVQAEATAKEALRLATESQNLQLQAEALYQLASYYSRVASQFKLSIEYCEQALEISNSLEDIVLQARLLRLLGMNENYLGCIESAQEHFQEAIRLIENQPARNYQMDEELGFLYYYNSVLHKGPLQKDSVQQCLYKSIEIFERIGNKEGLARCYNMLANHLNELKNHKEALHYHLKAIDLFEQLKEEYYVAVVQNNAGYSYCELGDFDKGFEMLFRSLRTKQKFGNQNSIANSYIHLGMAYKLKGNLGESMKYFHHAEKILKEINSKNDLATVYEFLSDVYAESGDFKKGYEYHILFDKTKDEMFNFEKAAAIMDAQSRFELEKKRKEAEMLRQKNKEIEMYAHQLEISNNELKQFAHVASHDLKEPLRQISNYIHILDKNIGNHSDSNIKSYMEFIHEGSKRMFLLINSLLEFSKLNEELNPEEVDLNNLIKEIQNQFTANLQGCYFHVDHLPVIYADKLHLYRLFENLVSNAIKFNPSKKKIIRIEYNENLDYHEIRVVDNGIGIPEEYREKVFEIFQRLHPRDKFPGTGIGLAICKKIVEYLKGKITVESNEYGGSTFLISLPKESVACIYG
ncbi:MAG: tetratricopeptide repeat protein [Chitinophagales bacterium]|nr:tetratricopeptide repeat protein [Chitinophagales bacterium]